LIPFKTAGSFITPLFTTVLSSSSKGLLINFGRLVKKKTGAGRQFLQYEKPETAFIRY
jgi:hypothetical protein